MAPSKAPVTATQTRFQLDPGAAVAIEELKSVFGVTNSTAVIRKAIALARVAAGDGDQADGKVTIVNSAGMPFKVSLTG